MKKAGAPGVSGQNVVTTGQAEPEPVLEIDGSRIRSTLDLAPLLGVPEGYQGASAVPAINKFSDFVIHEADKMPPNLLPGGRTLSVVALRAERAKREDDPGRTMDDFINDLKSESAQS